MENNMNSLQLEDIVKNNLANYEARYDANDWSRMEAMLGAAPDSSSFNWKPVLIVFIVCIFLGGAYALYTYLDFSGSTQKPLPYTPPVAKKPTVTPPTKKIVPVITTPPVDTVFKDEHEDEPVITSPDEETTVARSESKPEKEKIVSEDSEKELQRKKEESEARRARRRALAAAADSAKAAEPTKDLSKKNEKSEKKEKTKSSSAIGFNIFSTINADSLKKYQERMKKDSVK
jgi:type IV secretory pathway VirB10-like protein